MSLITWELGRTEQPCLVLGIIFMGVAFPILWTTFSKRGNSGMDERIELMMLFIKIFSVDKIRCLFGDREFIGG